MTSPDPDTVARRRDERDHLLASLDDLDAEHAAGDLDDDDYAALRDDYTARAAAAIRAVDESGDHGPPPGTEAPLPSRSWVRLVGWSAAVLVVAVVAGVTIAQASGSRGANQVGSGDIRQTSRALLFEAGEQAAAGDLDGAVATYGEVLDIEPANVQAFTYRGWAHWQAGRPDQAADDLAEAVALDEAFADARVFSAVVALNEGMVDAAADHLVRFAQLDPPALMRDLVADARLRERTADGFGEQGRAADALAFLDRLLEADPDDAAVLAHRGWVLARTAVEAPELAEGAERFLADAVAADPSLPDPYVYQAFLFRFLERDDEARAALAAYDELVAEAGGDPPPHLDQLIEAQGLRQALTP